MKMFPSFSLNIYVPWNEVVVLDPVVMSRNHLESGITNYFPSVTTSNEAGGGSIACEDHDFDVMKPLVLATWKHGFQVKKRRKEY
jgi:hypothetical protein